MVPTIVIAGVIIGMITIIPSAMADHKKDDDKGKDWKTCKKWFYKADFVFFKILYTWNLDLIKIMYEELSSVSNNT